MPYTIRKRGRKYSVKNAITGRVFAYGTTLKRAKAQVRLLLSLDFKKIKGINI